MSIPYHGQYSQSLSNSSFPSREDRSPPLSELLPPSQLFPRIHADLQSDAPLRVKWECIRAVLDSDVPIHAIQQILQSTWDDYDSLWDQLSKVLPAERPRVRQRASLEAWRDATTSSGTVMLRGSLVLSGDDSRGYITARLDPLSHEEYGRSFRFSRAFGGDSLQAPDQLEAKLPYVVQKLAQRWKKSSSVARGVLYMCYEVKFFAIKGTGISESTCIKHTPASIEDVIQWLIPLDLEKNRSVLACKLYSRLELGFSKTYPTVAFLPGQIDEVNDAYGNAADEDTRFNDTNLDWAPFTTFMHQSSRVMTDGCARISVKAASALWQCFGTADPVPSVFQGRIANAKGLWLKSTDHEKDAKDPIWIETTASQRKFQRHDEDMDEATFDRNRTTFELLAWSGPLASSHLSVSLLSGLRERGISQSSIAKFIRAQMDFEKDQF
ncbi:uncharacterized protein K452DRAFT_363288 [Aplosporella prunicola CBS 121167]|uniref:RNA-dependent RNA polymerase n=1 Tax=Aplosporella prunicola CBS 121167 TaxID=1176127 RepID=A0A6A6AW96_9PEZI|nr:uncharacterized protein K452DRAFT_363288 [Aplosporella prunicola CBS 121167]KAF2135214.1 hypothetical protein K452DRAFT_363288 [Aplosporella prunicola CBS 121167]